MNTVLPSLARFFSTLVVFATLTARFTLLLALLVSLFVVRHSSFAQGELTPPGAPAPTMKTLDQVEPRRPIPSLPFTISQPGSYYLTTNLTGQLGILINQNNVTLDLNGFSLLGAASSFTAIATMGPRTNITVRNGSIYGWGSDGLDAATDGAVRSLTIERLTVSANGGYGIRVAGSGLVRDCVCVSNSVDGIGSSGCLVIDCVASENRFGISAGSGAVSGCLVRSNRLGGIHVSAPGCQIIRNNCIGNNTSGDGFNAGIVLNASNNLIEGNFVTGSGHSGIRVSATYTNNVVVRNVVFGNGANNYVNPGSNDFGPTGTAAASTSPWANLSN